MRPHTPEHAVVALLGQCFLAPKCRASRIGRQKLSGSSSAALHTLRLSRQRPQPAIPSSEKQRRHYRGHSQRFRNGVFSENSSLLLLGSPISPRTHFHFLERTSTYLPHKARFSSPSQAQKSIAVLGGGITGLATAQYVVRELPRAKVTIFEASEHLGGWVQSKSIEVEDGKRVLFEHGPRSLRVSSPSGLVTLELVKYLCEESCLLDDLLVATRDSEAAQNRFVYYPDHLVRMPGPGQTLLENVYSILVEPIFKNLIKGGVNEFRRLPRPNNLEDESVGAFLERRLGYPDLADNIVSAVLHGIYAGDIYQLSAKSLMPAVWEMEEDHGSILMAAAQHFRSQTKLVKYRDVVLQNAVLPKLRGPFLEPFKKASVYTFKGGLEQLTLGIRKSLTRSPNVEFKTSTAVTGVEYDEGSKKIKVITKPDQPSQPFDNVISTISARTLSTLTPHLPALSTMHSVTVMVVNLFYTNPNLLPDRGFGYLLPRSLPLTQNPERALGVVFDSIATPGQDDIEGTKLTVMLGGHWWDGFSTFPDEEEGLEMAKAVLKRHLRIEEEPTLTNVVLQKECIPQYTVGHEARMKSAHGELMRAFKGQLAVAGNSYTGVGFNDCVRAAYDVTVGVRDDDDVTGLEEFVDKKWAVVNLINWKAV